METGEYDKHAGDTVIVENNRMSQKAVLIIFCPIKITMESSNMCLETRELRNVIFWNTFVSILFICLRKKKIKCYRNIQPIYW